MAIPWGPIISSGASLFGGLIGERSSAKSQREANEANLSIAREQMAFQERMDSTKYQRGVADARAAGFNPLVAFPGSGGSPMGASATMLSERPNRGELAVSTARAAAEVASAFAENRLKNKMSDTEETKQDVNRQESLNMRLQNRLLQAQLPRAKNTEEYDKSSVGRGLSWVRNISGDVGGAVLAGLGLAGGSAKATAGLLGSLKNGRVLRKFPRY